MAWSSSEALFARAVEAVPDNYAALNGLGQYYWQQGQLEKAREQFETIVKMESDPHLHVEGGMEPAHRYLGLLLAVLHKPREAVREFDKAIEIQPNLPDARRHKAWLLATYPDEMHPGENVRNGDEAVRLAQEALDRSAWKPPEILGHARGCAGGNGKLQGSN